MDNIQDESESGLLPPDVLFPFDESVLPWSDARSKFSNVSSIPVACGADGSSGCTRAFAASTVLTQLPPCPRCGGKLMAVSLDWIPQHLRPLEPLGAVAVASRVKCEQCGDAIRQRDDGRPRQFCSAKCQKRAARGLAVSENANSSGSI